MHIPQIQLDGQLFSSKVARRAFVTFVACALLPVCALAVLAFQQVTAQLQEQGEKRLRQASKGVAIVLLNRLLAAEAALGEAGERGATPAGRLRRPLTAAMSTAADGSEQLLFGEMTRPAFTAARLATVAGGKTVLSVERDGTGRVLVFVSRLVEPARPDRGVVHGLVDPAFLWGFDDDAAVPAETRLIVLDGAGQVLFSSLGSGQTPPESVTRRAAERMAGHFAWRDDSGEYLATHWALFLQASMAVPKWTIVLSQSRADVFAPITAFTRIFVLVVVLAILTVLLLSVQQIRRSLTPLAQLKEGAQRLAMGDLDTRVEVTTRDEFANVATAFNDMASQLGRQFHTLALRREIMAALNPTQPLEDFLQVSAGALIRHLDLPLVGIWLSGGNQGALELRASARSEGASDREAPRIPVTEEELDRIRSGGQPYLTNALQADSHRADLAWAVKEGFVALLVHPLIVEGRVLGIVGAFARRPFEATELSTLGLAAGDMARCIDRRRVDDALRDSEMQTRQLQKMEAVGRLAGGIAHDFNNLLMVITGHTYLLLHKITPDDPHRKGIQTIDATAHRAAVLTSQLLGFSRKQVLAPTVLGLNEVIGGLGDILHRLIGEAIEFTFTPGAKLGKVKLDRGQVEQVLVNLVVNARDAMPRGGRITVETSNCLLDEAFVGMEGGKPGAHVMIAVTDTGTGMDEQTRAQIFEPFFTTKEVGKGTGLGLATVLGIVQQSGGHIRVESEVGVGTTFRIYFPHAEEAATRADVTMARPRGGSETVLVVDDEPEIQSVLQTALSGWGYTGLGATGPTEALRLAAQHSGPIDLLVTDMVMPEMSGAALAQRLGAVYPGMATLFMSGYADYTAEAIPDDGGRTGFLQKPFAPETVARLVRDVLDGTAASTSVR